MPNLSLPSTTCAFASPLLLSPHATSRATCAKSSFLTPRLPSPNEGAKIPKRRRVTPPSLSVRNTREDNVQAKVADFLLTSGRFFQTGTGQAVLWGGLIWLVLTGRIGVLFDSFLVLLAVVSIVPVVAVIIFRWWVGRQLVQTTCPNCGADVTGLRGQPFQCMSCGYTMEDVGNGDFAVSDPTSATIDIDAKEINDN